MQQIDAIPPPRRRAEDVQNVEFRKRSVDRPRRRDVYGLHRSNGPRAKPATKANAILVPNGRARDDVPTWDLARRGRCSAVSLRRLIAQQDTRRHLVEFSQSSTNSLQELRFSDLQACPCPLARRDRSSAAP